MKSRPPIETIFIYLLIAFVGLLAADLAIISNRHRLLPPDVKIVSRLKIQNAPRADRSSYGVIADRNIFSLDQKIPEPIGASKQEAEPDAPPIPSSLPIQLVGTIVHANPERSIATINLRNKNDQVPLKVHGIIPDHLGTIVSIERAKVILRNSATRRLEFIEMKDESKISFGSAPTVAKQMGEVMQKSDTEFELKQSDITRLTSNLPELLQQARAVPRLGPGGTIECFSIADIQQGSIYEKLGLRRGDCIKSVNGEKIDSPAKAMQLYNALRANAATINLGVERGGRDENMNYNIVQ